MSTGPPTAYSGEMEPTVSLQLRAVIPRESRESSTPQHTERTGSPAFAGNDRSDSIGTNLLQARSFTRAQATRSGSPRPCAATSAGTRIANARLILQT